MIFERLDRAFCEVATVEASRGELVCYLVCVEEFFEVGGYFVVEGGELRFETPRGEMGDDGFVGFDKLLFGAAGNGAGVDGVGIVLVEDEDVFVAAFGGAYKFSSLIGEDLARGFL